MPNPMHLPTDISGDVLMSIEGTVSGIRSLSLLHWKIKIVTRLKNFNHSQISQSGDEFICHICHSNQTNPFYKPSKGSNQLQTVHVSCVRI